MHIQLVTHYFPPESNAPANRAIEHARAWVALGHQVTIVTAAPSHPAGKLFPGFRNSFNRSRVEGIELIRLPTVIAPNRARGLRIVGFLSFFFSVLFNLWRIPRADVVVSTSPQFFCGLAGRLLRRRGMRWVLEIRDIWPESIVAVGAMKPSLIIRALEALERWAYRTADLVVVTTEAHRAHVEARGACQPALVIRNGVTLDLFARADGSGAAIRTAHRLGDAFVLTYLGTFGMAHGLEKVIEAAELCRDRPDIHFLLVGDGAERAALVERAERADLPNLTILPQQRREAVPAIWDATDAALVLLRDQPTFRSVLPSKMFEAMAVAKPVLLGVAGEAKQVLDEAGAGIAIPPEDALVLASAARMLADDRAAARAMGERGRAYVAAKLDRRELAAAMAARMAELAT